MSLNVKKEKGKVVLKFEGAITIYEVSEYKKTLMGAFSEEEGLEMDLSHTDACDTAGIQCICSIFKQASNIRKISITGMSKAVEEISQVLGINIEGLFEAKGV